MREKLSEEVRLLVDFLNLKLGLHPVARSLWPNVPKSRLSALAAKFFMEHELTGPLSDLQEAQSDIAYCLTCLQPEALETIPPNRDVTADDDFSRKSAAQQRALIDDLKSDPGRALRRLIDHLNKAEFGAQWILEDPIFVRGQQKTPNLYVGDLPFVLKKHVHGGRGKVFQWVARILERNELSKLRCCRVCKRFFIPYHKNDVRCSTKRAGKPTCKAFYDGRMSRPRKQTSNEKMAIAQREKGLPRFEYLARNNFDELRQLCGERIDAQLLRYRLDQGEASEQIWEELPPGIQRKLAAPSVSPARPFHQANGSNRGSRNDR